MFEFDLENETICSTIELFGHTEVAKSIYKGAWEPSKNKHPREYFNLSSGMNNKLL